MFVCSEKNKNVLHLLGEQSNQQPRYNYRLPGVTLNITLASTYPFVSRFPQLSQFSDWGAENSFCSSIHWISSGPLRFIYDIPSLRADRHHPDVSSFLPAPSAVLPDPVVSWAGTAAGPAGRSARASSLHRRWEQRWAAAAAAGGRCRAGAAPGVSALPAALQPPRAPTASSDSAPDERVDRTHPMLPVKPEDVKGCRSHTYKAKWLFETLTDD